MRYVLVLCLGVLATVLCPFAQATQEPLMGVPSQFQLPNGLKVVVIPDHRSPIAVQMLWYKAGSVDEQRGQSGIAHMLEHMMFRGTKNVPAGQFSAAVAALGGRHNAFTNSNATIYFQKVARINLAKVMELEADRMANLDLSDALFKPERDVVLEERHMRTDNKPQRLFGEQLMRLHYSVSPYGHPVLGWQQDIKNYTPQNARDWYANFYAPNNAVLVLAGDLTVEEGMALAKKYYGPIQPKAVLRQPIPPEPERYDARRMVTYNADAPSGVFQRFYRLPGRFEGVAASDVASKDVTALMVLARILGHEEAGMFHQALVVDRRLADSVGVSYDPVVRGEAILGVQVIPKPTVAPEEVENAVNEVIGGLVTHGVSAEDITRAITRLKFDYVMLKDDVYLNAYHMARWVLYGGTADTLESWQKELDTLTPEDILRVARTYLRLENSTTGLLINHKAPVATDAPAPAQIQKEGGL
jgi:zinc protease